MDLMLYDTEEANPLAARIRNIDYDYQAEQHLIDGREDEMWTNPARWIVRAELVDSQGVRAKWTRADGDRGYFKIVEAAPRFQGVRPT